MKYIKLYENIDFDDISDEEFEFDNNILNDIHIKPCDKLLPQYLNVWYNDKWFNHYYIPNNYYELIDKIELSDNIIGNPYGKYNNSFKKIPDNQIMFSIKDIWCWFKYDKNIKIK